MKTFLFGALSLLFVTLGLAAPAGEAEVNAPVSAVEERTFFNLWKPGYKPYKFKIYCPAKPCHDKYLCEKPGKDDEPSHLGYTSATQSDFQFYLADGATDDEYKYVDYNDQSRTISLAGPPEYHNICPVKEPPKYDFPNGWDCKYDKWWISPVYSKFQKWWQITIEFFKIVRYWELKEGWKWIVHGDGKGGWDVKAWDGNYKFEFEYYECKIVVEAQYKKWGFPWAH
ncbi:MAG: hypothetical protein L6R40_005357 [Gallowayella cf. fulva]|nr:MAG: hypothetical protein L6R40_005357 [Xanthomendoza cf. fulva]